MKAPSWVPAHVASVVLAMGCAGGPNPETLVEELRVIALVAEPPEVAPGESVTLTAHVANPDQSQSNAGAWTCVGFGGQCLETDATRLSVTTEVVAQTEWSVPTPVESAALLEEEDEGAVSLWVLACEAGLCPLLETDSPATQDLADPTAMLESLPMEGVSLARRSVWVSTRTEEDRRQNPTIVSTSDAELLVDINAETELSFQVSGPAETGYGYATGGGFTETEADIEDGALTLTYAAPDEAGTHDLWVVVQAEDEGVAVWNGVVTVE